eukprot:tig00021094_g18116.t2
MKLNVTVAGTSFVVPCGDGQILVSALIDLTLQRAKKRLSTGSDAPLRIRLLRNSHGAILDDEDLVADVLNDNELVIAEVEEGSAPAPAAPPQAAASPATAAAATTPTSPPAPQPRAPFEFQPASGGPEFQPQQAPPAPGPFVFSAGGRAPQTPPQQPAAGQPGQQQQTPPAPGTFAFSFGGSAPQQGTPPGGRGQGAEQAPAQQPREEEEDDLYGDGGGEPMQDEEDEEEEDEEGDEDEEGSDDEEEDEEGYDEEEEEYGEDEDEEEEGEEEGYEPEPPFGCPSCGNPSCGRRAEEEEEEEEEQGGNSDGSLPRPRSPRPAGRQAPPPGDRPRLGRRRRRPAGGSASGAGGGVAWRADRRVRSPVPRGSDPERAAERELAAPRPTPAAELRRHIGALARQFHPDKFLQVHGGVLPPGAVLIASARARAVCEALVMARELLVDGKRVSVLGRPSVNLAEYKGLLRTALRTRAARPRKCGCVAQSCGAWCACRGCHAPAAAAVPAARANAGQFETVSFRVKTLAGAASVAVRLPRTALVRDIDRFAAALAPGPRAAGGGQYVRHGRTLGPEQTLFSAGIQEGETLVYIVGGSGPAPRAPARRNPAAGDDGVLYHESPFAAHAEAWTAGLDGPGAGEEIGAGAGSLRLVVTDGTGRAPPQPLVVSRTVSLAHLREVAARMVVPGGGEPPPGRGVHLYTREMALDADEDRARLPLSAWGLASNDEIIAIPYSSEPILRRGPAAAAAAEYKGAAGEDDEPERAPAAPSPPPPAAAPPAARPRPANSDSGAGARASSRRRPSGSRRARGRRRPASPASSPPSTSSPSPPRTAPPAAAAAGRARVRARARAGAPGPLPPAARASVAVARLLRLSRLPPAAAALGSVLRGAALGDAGRGALAEGLWRAFRALSPPSVRGEALFERSQALLAWLLRAAEGPEEEAEARAVAAALVRLDLSCPLSSARVVRPAAVDGDPAAPVFSHGAASERLPCDVPAASGSLRLSGDDAARLVDLPARHPVSRALLAHPGLSCPVLFCEALLPGAAERAALRRQLLGGEAADEAAAALAALSGPAPPAPLDAAALDAELRRSAPWLCLKPTLALKGAVRWPCVTLYVGEFLDESAGPLCSVAVGRGKGGGPNNTVLFVPVPGVEANIDPDDLARALGGAASEAGGRLDERPAREAVLALLDVSDSMALPWDTTASPGGSEAGTMSRMDAVKALFHAFANRTMAYDLCHEVGLVLFGENVKTTCPLTPALEAFKLHVDNASVQRGTRIFDALQRALRELESASAAARARGAPPFFRRVLVFTDGADTGSSADPFELCRLLAAARVAVDAVLLGPAGETDADLKALVHATGGYCFRPGNLPEAMRLFENECVLQYEGRANAAAPTAAPAVPGTRAEFAAFATRPDDRDPQRRPPPQLSARVQPLERTVGSAAAHNAPGRAGDLPSRRRLQRILREAAHYHREPHGRIHVFPCESDLTFWQALLEGPEGSPYAGGTFLLYAAPEVRFVTPIYHCNVNSAGRVCHSVFDRNWTPDTSTRTVLDCVYGLLLEPEPDDPLDSTAAAQYHAQYHAYVEAAVATTREKAGKTEEPPGDLVCPITGALFVDPVLSRPSGVTYERGALREHIARAQREGRPALDPVTRQAISLRDLIPNRAARDLAQRWRAQHPGAPA